MWLRHWNFVRDPFQSGVGPYVATPPHDDTVSRLLDALANHEPLVELNGEPGSGKSVIFRRALALAREPGLRIARASAPSDDDDLFLQLAQSLRIRLASHSRASEARRALREATKLIAAQNGRVLFAIDGYGDLCRVHELAGLVNLGEPCSILLTRSDEDDAFEHGLTIRLSRLTRSDASAYLTAKLRQVGRDAPAFSTVSLTQLHAMSEGIPRRLERLAGLALRAAAHTGTSLVDDQTIQQLDINPSGWLALSGVPL